MDQLDGFAVSECIRERESEADTFSGCDGENKEAYEADVYYSTYALMS